MNEASTVIRNRTIRPHGSRPERTCHFEPVRLTGGPCSRYSFQAVIIGTNIILVTGILQKFPTRCSSGTSRCSSQLRRPSSSSSISSSEDNSRVEASKRSRTSRVTRPGSSRPGSKVRDYNPQYVAAFLLIRVATCSNYLCPDTLACVHFPHHCPCAFPEVEDKVELADGIRVCASKGGFKEGETLRKIELARKGLN